LDKQGRVNERKLPKLLSLNGQHLRILGHADQGSGGMPIGILG
jgi:hypothetical protein